VKAALPLDRQGCIGTMTIVVINIMIAIVLIVCCTSALHTAHDRRDGHETYGSEGVWTPDDS